jgi:3-hydroxyacyl-[acyl-carrier-protein] dehydratase
MRFQLVDRILEVQPGKLIRAEKYLTLGEEYLADHFPTFPVMPGVLMLEAVLEAGAWLVRVTEGFRHSVTVVREVKNVKFGTFMEPGRTLTITAEYLNSDGDLHVLKGRGESEGASTVSAKFSLASYDLDPGDGHQVRRNQRLAQHWQDLYEVLTAKPA